MEFKSKLFISWFFSLFRWIFGRSNSNTVNVNTDEGIKIENNKSVSNKKFIQKSGKNSTNVQGENITVNKYDNKE